MPACECCNKDVVKDKMVYSEKALACKACAARLQNTSPEGSLEQYYCAVCQEEHVGSERPGYKVEAGHVCNVVRSSITYAYKDFSRLNPDESDEEEEGEAEGFDD